jgi:hypothetical protein
LQNLSKTPPSEIGLNATKKESEGQLILEEKGSDTEPNLGETDNGTQNPHSEGISAQQLGKRLKRSGQALRQQQKKGEKAFAKWTRDLDPEGKAWKPNREGKQVKYYLV